MNIVLRVALGSAVIIFTKFDLRQLIRAWIIAFFMLISCVTLLSWPLTCWPWQFVVHQASGDQSMRIEQSSAELLIILRIFARYLTLW